jgi:hypothetical protein
VYPRDDLVADRQELVWTEMSGIVQERRLAGERRAL